MKTYMTKTQNGQEAPRIFAPDIDSAKKVLQKLKESVDPDIEIIGELLEIKDDNRKILHD